MIIQLESGKLTLEVSRSQYPINEICGFASRINAKRGFLFVSKILGKHVPVPPAKMRKAYQELASQLQLTGATVFVALAETATALGAGVHDSYVKQLATTAPAHEASQRAFCLATTRYPVTDEFIGFDEPHSHAPTQFIRSPAFLPEQFRQTVQNLVLVDDELTTGTTLCNVAAVITKFFPALRSLTFVCLTDWLGIARTAELTTLFEKQGLQLRVVSLLAGSYTFAAAQMPTTPTAAGILSEPGKANTQLARVTSADSARFGYFQCRNLEAEAATERFPLSSQPKKILVLGTGEFAYEPFLFAEELEKAGHAVVYQTTTRSPIRIGQAITSRISFLDNYLDEITNFVYNVDTTDYDHVYLCYESAFSAERHHVPMPHTKKVLTKFGAVQ